LQYRKLGRWGMKVSTIGLGSWLTYGGSVEEDAARACIRRAYDQGVNFFDTANAYARGRSEEVVGKALAEYPRDSVVIATKVFFRMGSGPNDGGLSRKHVTEQCHHSLRRLGVDYIDLYQCHRYDEDTPVEETCRVMDDLVTQGKILYWGVSEWTADQIGHAVSVCRANGWSVPVSNQPQYSALYRPYEREVFPACLEHGLGNVVWSPLAQGVLTGKYRSVSDVPPDSRAAGESGQTMQGFMRQETLDAVQQLAPIAEEVGVSIAQLSLAWCLHHPAVTSVIVGATKTSHVDDNVAAATVTLSDDIVERINQVLQPVAAT
jgi:voltage-dependent potassium channel beta subunit